MIECWVEITGGLGMRKNKFCLDFNLERFREKPIFNFDLKCGPKCS